MANAKRSTDEFEADASMLNYYSRNSVRNAARTDVVRTGDVIRSEDVIRAIRTGAARAPANVTTSLLQRSGKFWKKKERRDGPRHPAPTEDAF